jgi:hypothetical protein
MHKMMDFQLAKQRHEQVLREAESRRQARALREARKRRGSQTSVLVWEMKGHAERLLKLLRLPRTTG